ncbi:beta/gamma crystallin-related protein [Henriciella sp.]|uniref:beta/gamma crystallin-related protein n=1 Tax=Henriciella sp. TaxID=1968823 RepID=UPI002631E27E|nr:beta/gamma crystallin-related protein [Henriciella sp.]
MTALKALGLSLTLSAALALPATAQYGRHSAGGEAIVYAHPDFTGQSLRVTHAIPHLNRYRFNDKASSIRVTGGSWEVCVDPNYRGRCEIITYREGQLNQIRLNDKITSIRPVAHRRDRWNRDDRWDRHRDRGYRGRQSAPIVLYQHPDFRGSALPVDGAIPHLNQLRFNDKVSSIALQSGVWEVCTDPNFRGRCEIIDRSVPQTNVYRLNDNITSIRPAGRGYGRRW